MSGVNAELIVKQWLESYTPLAGYPVSFDVPKNRPQKFITIERTGGASTQFLDNPVIAVQVWDTSRWNASDVALRIVKPRLLQLWQHPNVGSVNVESVVNLPEPDAPYSPRYQIVISLTTAVYE